MATVKKYNPKIRQAKPYPGPKRATRLAPGAARAMMRNTRKAKSR